MAQLTVGKVPEDLARALRVRAARHGRPAEAEHRRILGEALRSEANAQPGDQVPFALLVGSCWTLSQVTVGGEI